MICEICGRPAEHRHHKFSQTKWARKIYGKLLDDINSLADLMPPFQYWTKMINTCGAIKKGQSHEQG